MPSFSDSIFLFILALLLFGPKRLPVLARELGKWVGEFRRASNEFKMQMEDELRQSEQADRQKQIEAMEAAAPVPPSLEPEHPHLPASEYATPLATGTGEPPAAAEPDALSPSPTPLPIATSGGLNLMPPSTGLPTPRGRERQAGFPAESSKDRVDRFDESDRLDSSGSRDALGGLLGSIPEVSEAGLQAAAEIRDTGLQEPSVREAAAHGR